MKEAKTGRHLDRTQALQALKIAVWEGMVWRYEHVVAEALAAGATDEEIDAAAHEAVEALLANAELPLSLRQLAQF